MSAIKFLSAAAMGLALAWMPAAAAQADWQIFKKPGSAKAQSAQVAQSGEAANRIIQLEEQLRQLNGRIEDLNFQLLQMQEELRRMQEDNELRFQELESRKGIAPRDRQAARNNTEKAAEPRQPARAAEAPGDNRDGSIGRILEDEPQGKSGGLNPQALGTLTFDENGNIVDSALGKPIDLTRRGFDSGRQGASSTDQASIGHAFPDNPEELYDLGYGYVQAGEYQRAEQAFAEFASRYPDSPRISEARFWLGESLYAQGHFEEAARIFLDTHKQYPDGRMAPQTLMKLGVSLANMNQRELACATFAEVPKKYPQMSNAVRTALANERQAASCLVN
jgi:tol-pal system protein YbgF